MYSEYKRRFKASTEKIKFASIQTENINTFVIHIVGHSKEEYKIVILHFLSYASVECSCPDFVYARNVCKHIYWLGNKLCLPYHPLHWNPVVIEKQVYRTLQPSQCHPKGRNKDCCVCMEEIDYVHQHTTFCHVCKNSVHTECWTEFWRTNWNPICVICRNKYDENGP